MHPPPLIKVVITLKIILFKKLYVQPWKPLVTVCLYCMEFHTTAFLWNRFFFCIIMHEFLVTFDQIYVAFLHKTINFLKKSNKNVLIPKTAVYMHQIFSENNEHSVNGFLCPIIPQGWSGERPVRCWIPVHLWQFRVHPSGCLSAQQRPVWVGSTVCWTVSCWYVIHLPINPSMDPEYGVLIHT